MLGAFTVRARNRYKRSTWPFRWEYGNWVHGYEMSAEVAETIVGPERDASSEVLYVPADAHSQRTKPETVVR